jgi:hypothetical protein
VGRRPRTPVGPLRLPLGPPPPQRIGSRRDRAHRPGRDLRRHRPRRRLRCDEQGRRQRHEPQAAPGAPEGTVIATGVITLLFGVGLPVLVGVVNANSQSKSAPGGVKLSAAQPEGAQALRVNCAQCHRPRRGERRRAGRSATWIASSPSSPTGGEGRLHHRRDPRGPARAGRARCGGRWSTGGRRERRRLRRHGRRPVAPVCTCRPGRRGPASVRRASAASRSQHRSRCRRRSPRGVGRVSVYGLLRALVGVRRACSMCLLECVRG